MKKVLFLCMVALMVLTMLAGCSTSDDASGNNPAATTTGDTSPTTVEDPVLTPVSMNGYVFTVAAESAVLWDQEPGNSDHGDAVMDRVHKIEEDYDCDIQFTAVNPNDLATQIETKAMAGEKSYDLINMNLSILGKILPQKFLEPLNNVEGMHLGASYWYEQVTDIGTFGGKTFFVSPTFNMIATGGNAMFYNIDMLEELKLTNPWEYVKKGEWTWDKFVEMGTLAFKDSNGDNAVDTDDRAGAAVNDPFGDFAYYAYFGSLQKIIEENADGTVSLIMNSERSVTMYNKIHDMLKVKNFISYRPENNTNDQQAVGYQFQRDGNALFHMNVMGMGKNMGREADFRFGMVPLPSLENGDKNYCPITHNTSVYGLPIKNPDLNKAGIIFNALASIGQREVDVQIAEYVDNEWFGDEESMEMFKNAADYMLLDKASVFFENRDFVMGTRVIFNGIKEDQDFTSNYESARGAAEIQLNETWNKIVS